jgi:hypothetical protein
MTSSNTRQVSEFVGAVMGIRIKISCGNPSKEIEKVTYIPILGSDFTFHYFSGLLYPEKRDGTTRSVQN